MARCVLDPRGEGSGVRANAADEDFAEHGGGESTRSCVGGRRGYVVRARADLAPRPRARGLLRMSIEQAARAPMA